MDIKNYIEQNKDRFLEELFSLIRIPSISSIEAHKPDMIRCAERWKELMMEAGADKCEIMPTQGNPVVYAEKIIDASKPTILIYGHYDVMPIDPANEWRTDPFEPVVKDGFIWARGADDDKGQAFMHAKAFEYLVRTNQLPCNVKFMLEGEEEIGSVSLYDFCKENKELLKADVILVSDTSMIAADTPSITTGLRGLGYVEVKVTGPNRDLHSGLYGGAVANPINILCQMIAKLTDENNHITVPGFYDKVLVASQEERDLMAQAPFNEEEYKKAIDINALHGEKGYSTIERVGIRPSLDCCGIWGGYTGEGAKTLHRLLMETFIPNINNLPCINHIDGNKSNNRVDNLEWCTQSYNTNYGSANKKRSVSLSFEVEQFNMKGVKVAEYSSGKEAAKAVGVYPSDISRCVSGERLSCKGFIWRRKI